MGGYIEHRSDRRYPLDLAIHYEIGRQEEGVYVGRGRVVNMSSGGILMESDRVLAPRLKIRLRIEWPARLNDVVPLALHIEGLTVRANGRVAAVRILKSDFRTRPVIRAAGAMRQAR